MLGTPTLARPPLGRIKVSVLRACAYSSLISTVLGIPPTFVFHMPVSASLSLALHTTSISTDARCLSVPNTLPPLGRYLWTALVCSFNLTRLPVSCDFPAIDELNNTGQFSQMELGTDEDEHSIEMHLPYIRKVFEGYVFQHCPHLPMSHGFLFRKDISIVPILVGAIDKEKEVTFGRILAPYLASEDTFFVISSDFCHWGTRFSYTFYFSQTSSGLTTPIRLSRSTTAPHDLSTFPIHESISALDHEAMELLTLPPSTAHQAHVFFADYLARTKNTICGRHPIGVLLGALAVLQEERAKSPHLQWVKYEQSSRCFTIKDSSVSYASAYVTF